MLSGCGGSSGGAETTLNKLPITDANAITLLDAGSPPFETLQISNFPKLKSNIQSNSQQSLSWGDRHDETMISANFDITSIFQDKNDTVEVSLIPVLNNFSESDLNQDEVLPGAGVRTYNHQGVFMVASMNDSDGMIAYNSQHLFSFPGFILAVPTTKVGEGARWQYTLDVESGKVLTEVHLSAIEQDTLAVTIASTYSTNDEDATVGYINTLQAIYDKASLAIRSGSSTFEISQTVGVSVNGEPVDYTAKNRIIHTISRVMQ